MTDITLQNIESHPIGEIIALPPATLMGLLADAEEAARKAKLVREWIEGTVNLKYGQRFEALRRDQEKPYGVIHLEDNGCIVTCDLSKKPEWDQTKLAEITNRIRAGGGDVDEYVDISYRVAERKYAAWPEHLRQSFEPARTVKAGKPSYAIKIADGGRS